MRNPLISPRKPIVYAIINHKGGVGKTTTTLNLARALSLLSNDVLMIDLDPQANLTQSVGLNESSRNITGTLCRNEKLPIIEIYDTLHLVPSDLSLATAEMSLQAEHLLGYTKLKKALDTVKNQYDYVLIDCPPSLGILPINAIIAADEVIIVTQAEYLAITGTKTILELCEKLKEAMNEKLQIAGILFTQVDNTVVSKGIIAAMRKEYKEQIFDAVIRRTVGLKEASIQRVDIFKYKHESAGAKDYLALACEVFKIPNITLPE